MPVRLAPADPRGQFVQVPLTHPPLLRFHPSCRERGHRVGVACKCGLFAGDEIHKGGDGAHRFEADHDDTRCTVRAERRDTGETAVVTWTVADAVRARLLYEGKGELAGKLISRSDKGEVLPWEAYTGDMLYNRAADRACKRIAPEVAFGLYTEEEIERMADPEPVRVASTVPTVEAEPVDVDALRAMSDEHTGGAR